MLSLYHYYYFFSFVLFELDSQIESNQLYDLENEYIIIINSKSFSDFDHLPFIAYGD